MFENSKYTRHNTQNVTAAAEKVISVYPCSTQNYFAAHFDEKLVHS